MDFSVKATVHLDYSGEEWISTCVVTGIKSFTDAMNKLEEYYGTDIESISLEYEDCPVWVIEECELSKIDT